MIAHNEFIDIAVEHSIDVARFDAATQVFHKLVRIEHILANLATEPVIL